MPTAAVSLQAGGFFDTGVGPAPQCTVVRIGCLQSCGTTTAAFFQQTAADSRLLPSKQPTLQPPLQWLGGEISYLNPDSRSKKLIPLITCTVAAH